MAQRALILGGGFGGVAAAKRLRSLLPDTEIVLVDRGTHFVMGFRKTAAILGQSPMTDGARALADLKRFGIDVRQGEVTAIDPAARAAEIDGERIEADAVLIALGAETVPGAIPGLPEHGVDWYDGAQAERAHDALAAIDQGHVLIAIFGAPYKCPPAPFELALLANEAARERGARATFEVVSPLPSSLPIVGPTGCEAIEGRLAGQMIRFRPTTKLASVEAGAAVTADGERIAFDLLLAVPPHRVPAPVAGSGLTNPGGWIPVEPATLRTSADGVWAVGDCIVIQSPDGKPMPKSGEFAADAGLVAAAQMAASLGGPPSSVRFYGDGRCFLEAGNGEAMLVQGRFLGENGPAFELTPPSKDHLAAKWAFERERLDDWFGTA